MDAALVVETGRDDVETSKKRKVDGRRVVPVADGLKR